MRQSQLFIAGRWVDGESTRPVLDKFVQQPLAAVHQAGRDQVAEATRAVSVAAREPMPPPQRASVLTAASRLLAGRRDEFVDTIVGESGFTLSDAAREVDRAVQTLLLCGQEATRGHGEMVPLDGAPDGAGRIGFTLRFPLGVVCAITPFNSPLNTVAHKVGPALAAGNGVVLKPSAYTPLTAELFVRLLLDAGLPARLIALTQGPGATVGQWLLEDRIPAFYAFTGSTEVGEHIRRTVGLRRSQLELGSLSSTLVWADANLDACVPRCVAAAFRKAGQVCTSVQRLYVHRDVLAETLDRLVEQLRTRPAGDPRSPDTFVGPVISPGDAERITGWIGQALDRGARLVTGGGRHGSVVDPTVLTDVEPSMAVMCREVFGPVLVIRPVTDLDTALDEINDTPYGLAAGVFTRDLDRALHVATRLRMGSVHINETSSSRVDLMPYSGVKASGMGREGPRYAIEEMTEERLITISRAVER